MKSDIEIAQAARMRPIVELAMGLATGSTPLVFRTGVRTVISIIVVGVASALFTWFLPPSTITRLNVSQPRSYFVT